MSFELNNSFVSHTSNGSVVDIEEDVENKRGPKQLMFHQPSGIKSDADADDFQPQIPNLEFYINLDKKLSNKPKDSNVGELLSMCNSDAKLINWYREILADRL